MTPEKKAEYQRLASEIMEPVLQMAARRLEQCVEEIHATQIKPLRDEIEKYKRGWLDQAARDAAEIVRLEKIIDNLKGK